MADQYYILDARTMVGNCALWWRPEGAGYTCNLDDAGRYTLAEAESHRETDVPVRCDVAERIAVRHVDTDALRTATRKPPIFCFLNSRDPDGGGSVMAMAEDGKVLGGHLSSSEAFAMRDIGHLPGTFQDSRHDGFRKHYPDGFRTVWVDDPKAHPGLQAAYALNQQAAKEAKASSG
jgi:hypothetical protein